ncbi:hypothetical protein CC1G_00745 [Coprinopsis cinerea okayama7|uniref:Uncharacterized protein n=1 Tax=Coprinopsis cinerea (strain Okayama-7 / 130 / ATCC MYA-4618 / FGSC 9003) TaxID=240176 RepID=A8N9D1_COPC7|nr:hypothetical protein CC1G_00745 [Coprinopsis cinerea okayama7\|eukprot:XP_001831198.1 hypothetical protein CC1G_00745 [Coprinopsis cinerea okayama7\
MTELTRWVVMDNTDSRISYTGSWSRASGNTNQHNSHGNFGQVYQNTLHTTTTSSSLSFTFTGDSATILGTNDLSFNGNTPDPDWECALDGRVSADYKRDPFRHRENNWVFCRFRGLDAGQHTITLNVRTRGRAFWFDRIEYRPTGVVENEMVATTRDDADITYNGRWRPLAEVAYFTHETGGSITFPFVGDGISMWAMAPTELPRDASQGVYSIDGGDNVTFTIPGVGGVSEYNRRIFETPRLSHGRHVITVIYNGRSNVTPMVLDKFLISGGTNRRAPQEVSQDTPSSGGSSGGGSSGGSSSDGGSSSSGGSGGGGSEGSSGSESEVGGGGSGSNVSPSTGNGGSSRNDGPSSSGSSDNTEGQADSTSVARFTKPSDSATKDSSGNTLDEGADATGAVKTTNTGAIVGGVLGALAIILIATALIVFLRQRRAKKKRVSAFVDTFNPVNMTGANHYHNAHAPAMSYANTGTGAVSMYAGSQVSQSNFYASSHGHGRSTSVSNSDVTGTYPQHNPFDDSPPMYSAGR